MAIRFRVSWSAKHLSTKRHRWSSEESSEISESSGASKSSGLSGYHDPVGFEDFLQSTHSHSHRLLLTDIKLFTHFVQACLFLNSTCSLCLLHCYICWDIISFLLCCTSFNFLFSAACCDRQWSTLLQSAKQSTRDGTHQQTRTNEHHAINQLEGRLLLFPLRNLSRALKHVEQRSRNLNGTLNFAKLHRYSNGPLVFCLQHPPVHPVSTPPYKRTGSCRVRSLGTRVGKHVLPVLATKSCTDKAHGNLLQLQILRYFSVIHHLPEEFMILVFLRTSNPQKEESFCTQLRSCSSSAALFCFFSSFPISSKETFFLNKSFFGRRLCLCFAGSLFRLRNRRLISQKEGPLSSFAGFLPLSSLVDFPSQVFKWRSWFEIPLVLVVLVPWVCLCFTLGHLAAVIWAPSWTSSNGASKGSKLLWTTLWQKPQSRC